MPATSALLPASDVVPATSNAPRTPAPYVRKSPTPPARVSFQHGGFPHGEFRMRDARSGTQASGKWRPSTRRARTPMRHCLPWQVRFLLRPWLALITTVMLFAIACYARSRRGSSGAKPTATPSSRRSTPPTAPRRSRCREVRPPVPASDRRSSGGR